MEYAKNILQNITGNGIKKVGYVSSDLYAEHDKKLYRVDCKAIKHIESSRELEVGFLVAKLLGVNVRFIPVVLIPQNVNTADYYINDIKYDLKEIRKIGKNTIYYAIKSSKNQAKRFIVDISEYPDEIDYAERQIDIIFWSKYTRFVEQIILIKNKEIIGIYINK